MSRPTVSRPTVRILSYNIHKGIGGQDRRYRLHRIVEVIEELAPDVVCLQEVDHNCRRSGFDDQPKVLAERLRLDSLEYQHNVRVRAGGYGNLLLSRWPLSSKHQLSLRMKTKKPRGAQIVVIETPQGALHVVNWHLGLAERERHWQVNHLLTHALFQQSTHLPTLIIGDYNDWRNQLKKTSLAEHGFEQITHPPSRFRSFPAYLPLGALDKAFFRGPLAVERAFIARNPLSRKASDHLPLVIDLQIVENGNGQNGAV